MQGKARWAECTSWAAKSGNWPGSLHPPPPHTSQITASKDYQATSFHQGLTATVERYGQHVTSAQCTTSVAKESRKSCGEPTPPPFLPSTPTLPRSGALLPQTLVLSNLTSDAEDLSTPPATGAPDGKERKEGLKRAGGRLTPAGGVFVKSSARCYERRFGFGLDPPRAQA